MNSDQITPIVPWVYREEGYLVLTMRVRAGEVLYYSTANKKSSTQSFPRFMARMNQPSPEVNPYRFMLNLLAQEHVGLISIRVRDQRRRILKMIEKSREELLKLDPAKLGEEYARIVGKKPPPQSNIDQMVEELLMSVAEEVAKKEEKEKTDGQPESSKPAASEGSAAPTPAAEPAAAAQPAAEGATAVTTKKASTAAKKKASASKKPNVAPTKEDLARYAKLSKKGKKKPEPKKKAAAKPKKEKAAKKEKPAKKDGNPFRPGSKKAELFDFHKACGGDRTKVIEKGVKLGATESTSKSWYAVFTKLA